MDRVDRIKKNIKKLHGILSSKTSVTQELLNERAKDKERDAAERGIERSCACRK